MWFCYVIRAYKLVKADKWCWEVCIYVRWSKWNFDCSSTLDSKIETDSIALGSILLENNCLWLLLWFI
jgi:hypothetical protein